jgi:hypothetical protein
LSAFTELLRRDAFVVTAELDPPRSANASVVRRRAGVLYAIEWPEGVTRVVENAGLLPRPTVREAVR